MTETTRRRLGLHLAPWVLWFGTLGGAVAWSLHTVVDWGIDETVCRSGHDSMVGVPLRPLIAGLSLFFLAVAVASLVVSYRHWQLFREAEGDDLQTLRRQRAALMAVVGLALNVLSVLAISFGSLAVFFLSACGTR